MLRIPLILLVIITGVALGACGKAKEPVPLRPTPTPTLEGRTPAGTGAGPGRTVTDMTGRTVDLPATVTRVITLSPTAVDLATALGLEIIGKASDSQGPDTAPNVGSSISPDFPAMAKLEPGLVIADAAYQGSFTRDFERFTYPVFVVDVTSYASVLSALDALGNATGRTAEAKQAAEAIRARVDAARARLAGKSPAVLIVTGQGREVYGASEATYAGDIAKLLGATNVLGPAADGAPLPGFATVDINQLATKNPDFVLVIARTQGPSLAADIRASAAWANRSVIPDNHVIELDARLFLRAPGPAIAGAAEKLAAILSGP
ncbi:MAG: ABC transporter substrate-binding protein [Dehalococcoidia bacterium]|nr:ABC transporter substrate-binding protein [Dehalococcoidia bacterium]